MPIGVPIRAPDGRTLGVLQSTLWLAQLSSQLNDVQLGQNGTVRLVTRDGTVLADPDPRQILRVLPPDPAIAAALAGRPAAMETTDTNGQAVFSAAVPLESLDWIVEVQIPRDEVLAPLRNGITRSVAAATAAVLLSIAVGLLVVRGMMAPIVHLRAATRQVANGTLDGPPLRIRSKDELEDLAADFESMRRRLDRRSRRLQDLMRLNRRISSSLDPEAAFQEIVQGAVSLSGAPPPPSGWPTRRPDAGHPIVAGEQFEPG